MCWFGVLLCECFLVFVWLCVVIDVFLYCSGVFVFVLESFVVYGW